MLFPFANPRALTALILSCFVRAHDQPELRELEWPQTTRGCDLCRERRRGAALYTALTLQHSFVQPAYERVDFTGRAAQSRFESLYMNCNSPKLSIAYIHIHKGCIFHVMYASFHWGAAGSCV